MKKITLILGFLFATTFSFAQTPLTEAVDFTTTDVNGNEINLFSILDGGQYVCIDFFFINCGACTTTVPYLVEAYELFGCNTADLFVMSVDYCDTDAEVIAYNEGLEIEFPAISGVEGGGQAITVSYGIPAVPCYIVIAPNHDIVIDRIWPPLSTQIFIDAFEGQGIEQADCNSVSTDFTIKETIGDAVQVYPNPANDIVNISSNSNMVSVSVYNLTGQLMEDFKLNESSFQINTSSFPTGVYSIKIEADNNTIIKRLVIK